MFIRVLCFMVVLATSGGCALMDPQTYFIMQALAEVDRVQKEGEASCKDTPFCIYKVKENGTEFSFRIGEREVYRLVGTVNGTTLEGPGDPSRGLQPLALNYAERSCPTCVPAYASRKRAEVFGALFMIQVRDGYHSALFMKGMGAVTKTSWNPSAPPFIMFR